MSKPFCVFSGFLLLFCLFFLLRKGFSTQPGCPGLSASIKGVCCRVLPKPFILNQLVGTKNTFPHKIINGAAELTTVAEVM